MILIIFQVLLLWNIFICYMMYFATRRNSSLSKLRVLIVPFLCTAYCRTADQINKILPLTLPWACCWVNIRLSCVTQWLSEQNVVQEAIALTWRVLPSSVVDAVDLISGRISRTIIRPTSLIEYAPVQQHKHGEGMSTLSAFACFRAKCSRSIAFAIVYALRQTWSWRSCTLVVSVVLAVDDEKHLV